MNFSVDDGHQDASYTVPARRSPLAEHFTPDELEAWETLMPLVRVQAILEQTTRRELGEVVEEQKADEDWPYTGISYY